MASREVIQSYVTNAAQAITRAAPLTKMFTLVNLFVIEAPLPINIACSTSSHANCNFKQLRTQRQSRPLGIREVNLETHPVTFCNELDHAAAPGELGHVTDCQDTHPIEHIQDVFKSSLFGRTNEQNLATGPVLGSRNPLYENISAFNAFAGNGGLECRIEGISTKHTNVERTVR